MSSLPLHVVFPKAGADGRNTPGIGAQIMPYRNCTMSKTIKGKGVSFMENQAGWHGKATNQEEFQQAMKELGGDL